MDPLLTELLDCLEHPPSGERERQLEALFTSDVRCSTPDQTLVGAGWWTRVPSFPRMDGGSMLQVHYAVRSGDQAALLFDALNLVTGDATRHAWALTLTDDKIRRIHLSATALRPRPPTITSPAVGSLGWLSARFALHPWTAEDGGMTLAEAMRLAAAHVSTLPEPEGEVLVNAHLFLLPIGWIGCSGILIERETGRVDLLGSGCSAAVHVWAWYRGFASGKTRDQRPNTLRVGAVRDPTRLDALVARLYPALGDGAVVARDGLCFEDVDLYFLRRDLLDVEEDGAFEFAVTGAELRPAPPVPIGS